MRCLRVCVFVLSHFLLLLPLHRILLHGRGEAPERECLLSLACTPTLLTCTATHNTHRLFYPCAKYVVEAEMTCFPLGMKHAK